MNVSESTGISINHCNRICNKAQSRPQGYMGGALSKLFFWVLSLFFRPTVFVNCDTVIEYHGFCDTPWILSQSTFKMRRYSKYAKAAIKRPIITAANLFTFLISYPKGAKSFTLTQRTNNEFFYYQEYFLSLL